MGNLAHDLREAAQMYPERPAVALDDTIVSYALLDELSARVVATRRMSRSKMMVSAARGMPNKPRRAANSPSFITPSLTRSGSSVWCTTSASKSPA